ncbi:60S acidic ribosomal protein P2-3 [Raphanus sativus]|uniref:60S acidic ribosomal protein P2-3 n=1 Tax=Raphanus sativus TaxID=3726 RepID=A0A6J0JRU9_RAPSA|nr:60S acidic ribosomal protein P2-3 [Raphanus sativus]KAJ4888213.1 60S acidic ribosomal protein P2-3 [Raphanus sativus]
MKVIAAFLLAKLAGNEKPTKDDVKSIFDSVGAEFDEKKTDLFFSLVKDHDVTELIAAGREKMGALSSGGGGGVAMVAGGAGGDEGKAAEPAAETKKVEEEKEESDDGGMMSLFD